MLLLLFANLSLIEQLCHQLTVKHQNVEFCFIYFYSLMNTFHGLLPRWMCAKKKKCDRLPILVQLHRNVLSVFKTMALILGVSLQYSQHTVAASTDTGKQNRVPLQCHTVETSQRCLRSKENKRLVSNKRGSGSCNLVPPRQHQHKISCKSLQRERFVTGPPQPPQSQPHRVLFEILL